MKIIDFIKSNNAYFEDYITCSTYHSNNIEGNTLSYAETYVIIFNDNSFKINAQPRELYEVINHKYATNYMLENINNPFSEKLIRKIAILINANINDIYGYRTTQVLIHGSEHIPLDAALVNQAMMHFVHNYNNTEYDDIYNKIAQNHIAFEKMILLIAIKNSHL